MLTRPIPSTGEMLPVLGLGTWRGFDIGRGREVRQSRRDVLSALFAAGGSVIDCSPMYGRAEAVVGDLLADMDGSERAFVATKVWTRGARRGIAEMTRSMERMRADPIDLIQVHNLIDWRTHLATLRGWKAEGRVRYIGITHYTVSAFDDLMDVLRAEPLDFVQLPLSIALPDAEERLLPLAADCGVAVLVNRPFEGGGLFGAARDRPLPRLAAELGCQSWAQLMLKYVISHPAVTCVIPGTGNPDRAREDFAAGDSPQPEPAQRRELRDIWRRG